jgi:hypothetical protein
MSEESRWLDFAGSRAQCESWTLGCTLSRLTQLEDTTGTDLAAELNCDATTVQWIFLCRAPSEEHFAEDVARIALRFSVDPNRLAALVRRADALAALAAESHNASESILLAARDREGDEGKS